MRARNLIRILSLSAVAALAAPSTHADDSKSKPSAELQKAPPLAIKSLSKLKLENAAGLPGETKTLKATLTTGGNPLTNKSVKFAIKTGGGDVVCGTDATDRGGVAKVQCKLPELNQGNYTMVASFAGDAHTFPSKDEANLLMIKSITKIELSNLIWGTYKNEKGPPYGTYMIKLIRTSDGTALAKPMEITLNGSTHTVNHGSNPSAVVQMALTGNGPWSVSVQFNGDGANAATSASKTYHHP